MPKAPATTKAKTKSLSSTNNIEEAIHVIRGHRVMLDEELARLYGVPTGRLNEAVKRNSGRFPADFAFRLTVAESENLKSQSAISKAPSKTHGGRRRSVPMAFTEQGIAMLSSVLNSERAIAVNIGIMRAFVKIRQAITINAELAKRLAVVEARLDQHRAETGKTLSEHEQHIRVVFETIRRLMVEDDDKPSPRVGFKLG
jgi:ORF6N domain